jgi:hypothetical protein
MPLLLLLLLLLLLVQWPWLAPAVRISHALASRES